MAQIGTFTKNADGSFIGEIVTLSVQAKDVRIIPEETRSSDSAPSHRIMVGRAEIGVGWTKVSAEERPYLALKFDDPSFIAPIYANLLEKADGGAHSLIWSRPARRGND